MLLDQYVLDITDLMPRRRKSKSKINSRLEQLRVRRDPNQITIDHTVAHPVLNYVFADKNPLAVTKHNIQRMTAGLAKRNLDMIRYHLQKKGVIQIWAAILQGKSLAAR